MRSVDSLIKLFREHGHKITPQRRLIFEILVEKNNHPTAEEIYQDVTKTMPEVSLATVYNTLHELVTLGELDEVIDMNEDGLRYDTITEDHHHLFCLRCHRIVDIHIDDVVNVPFPQDIADFEIIKQQVIFYGYCPDCKTRDRENL